MSSYESIKSIIRVLLTSSSNGLTLEELNADYQQYNQSNNIPYENFGYQSLIEFLSDMSDIVQFDFNSSPLIIYGIKTGNQIPTIINRRNKKFPISNFKNNKKSINKYSSKNVKRLALVPLSKSNQQSNGSTDCLIDQLTNLTMHKNNLKNFSSYEILTISINSINQYQIIRYPNGKYFISCFELSHILNINENIIDKETMFSRIRIYQSHDLFYLFKNMKNNCKHKMNCHRPYFFLFLISSIIPILKMNRCNNNQYYHVVLAFEQLFI